MTSLLQRRCAVVTVYLACLVGPSAGQGLDTNACDAITGCDETALLQHARTHEVDAADCDTSALVKAHSILVEASKNSSAVCKFATHNKECVEEHYKAFEDSASYLAGHSPSTEFLGVAFNELYALHDSKQAASTLETGVKKSELDPFRCQKALFPGMKPTWQQSMTKQGVKFTVDVLHDRHDHQCPNCPDNHYLAAVWKRKVMMQRYLIQYGDELPSNVVLNTTDKYIATVNTVRDSSISEFNLTDPCQLKAVQERIADVQWGNVIIHTYAALTNVFGNIYSPAFNSIWLVYDKTTEDLSHYMIIAADAEGTARQKYIGIDYDTLYESIAGFDYTPLTGSIRNPLYFKLPKFDPTDFADTWSFFIDMWHAKSAPPQEAYIRVTSDFSCTMFDLNWAPVIVNVVAKEYYMNEIILGWCGDDPVTWVKQGNDDVMLAPFCESMKSLGDSFKKLVAPQDYIDQCASKEAKLFFDEGDLFKLLRSLLTPWLDIFGWKTKPQCKKDGVKHAMLSTDAMVEQ